MADISLLRPVFPAVLEATKSCMMSLGRYNIKFTLRRPHESAVTIYFSVVSGKPGNLYELVESLDRLRRVLLSLDESVSLAG